MADPNRPQAPNPNDSLPAPATFTLTSEDLRDGHTMPQAHVASGGNESPQLSWSGAPAGTRGYIVACFDPDAPTFSGWWHWFVGAIPASVTSLPRGAGEAGGANLPAGATQLRNDGGGNGWMGAAPPAGDRPHRYVFTVHAMNTDEFDFAFDSPVAYASFFAVANELARATLTVTYQNL